MKYIAQIIECNENLEFILKIKVRNEILEVFSSSIPSFIDLKKNYLIALEATIFDDYLIEKIRKHPANTALPSDPISLNLVPT